MKIAQVVSTPPFAWSTGGPARAVFELSKALVSRNLDVSILTTNLFHGETAKGWEKPPDSHDGVRIQYFSIIGGHLAWKTKLYISPALIWSLKYIGKEFNIIHLQDLISPQAIAVSFFSKKSGVPYILTTHGSVPWLTEKKPIHILYYRLFGKRVLKNASRIIALTPAEKRELLELSVPEEKIVIVPNGINLSEFRDLPKRGHFRSKYHIGDREKIILFHGRIHPIKGVDLLIDTMFHLVHDHPDLRLVIAGHDDGFTEKLKRQVDRLQIHDYIVFTGQLGEQEKIAAYVDADIFVLPSIHEGFPLTVLEAMACGTPVIITKGCNISEVVENCGLVIDRHRDNLKDAILTILGNSTLRKDLVKHGPEKVKEVYNWDCIAEKISVIYEECLKENQF